MIEDQLTHDERLRLECVAQAVQSHLCHDAHDIIEIARAIERYLEKRDI